jgi:hypothetical protein
MTGELQDLGNEGTGFSKGKVVYVATIRGDKVEISIDLSVYNLLKEDWNVLIRKAVKEDNKR